MKRRRRGKTAVIRKTSETDVKFQKKTKIKKSVSIFEKERGGEGGERESERLCVCEGG